MSFGGEGPTTTTNSNTSGTTQQNLPSWFLSEWQNLLGQGHDLNTGLLTPVAGLMPDQEAASWLTGGALQEFMNRQRIPAYDVFGMGQNWDQGVIPVAQATAAGGIGAGGAKASLADPASATAAQLAPKDIAPFMNPFIDTALDPTMRRLATQQGEVQAGIGANAAASGMFGGSREAVARSLADRNYRDTAANTVGNMMNQGWNTAAGLAGANVDRSQAVNLANAGFEQAANQLNAQLGTNTSVANMQAQAQAGVAGAQLANQVALANAAAQNQAQQNYQNLSYQGSQADADRFLRAVAQQEVGDATDFQATLGGINTMNQLGTQQQQTAQRALDYYWQQLSQLASLLRIANPGMNTNTTTQGTTIANTTKPTDWGSILLGGLGLATKAAPLLGLSDRKDKTDIKKLGKDPDTGIPLYAYRYKGDPKSYPKVVGPMADDLERFLPGITKLVGGHQVVKLG
jgi:hypothetical protein